MIEIEVYRRERRKNDLVCRQIPCGFSLVVKEKVGGGENGQKKIDGYRRRKHMTSVSSV